MDDVTPERWLPVPGWEVLYEASDYGFIRSLPRVDRLGRHWRGRILKPHIDKDGYGCVVLSGDGNRSKPIRVHQLVTAAFLGPCPEGKEVRHDDGDPRNNRLSNLLYGTHAENMHDKARHGTNYQANKTHCPKGHEYAPENTYIQPSTGGRVCKTCMGINGQGLGSHNRAKIHCPKGHPYDEENTYRSPSGHRRCRTCMREADRKRAESRKHRVTDLVTSGRI